MLLCSLYLSLFEEVGGIYRWEGDYLIPNLDLPETVPVGIWGQRRRRYLREHRNGIYTGMLLAGTLNALLVQVDTLAQEMLSQFSARLAISEGVTEELKAQNQMEWVRRMNNIRSRVEEIVNKELNYI